MQKINFDTKGKMQTAYHMVVGALILTVGAFAVWASANSDVLIKAIRYPEAVREMRIDVKVSQNEIVSPVAIEK